jgi:hypothetical protein
MLYVYLFIALLFVTITMIFLTKSKNSNLDFSWLIKKNELTKEDIEWNRLNYAPILPFIPPIRSIFQFVSGATAAGGLVMFFLNRLDVLPFWASISVSVTVALVVAFSFEKGILAIAKPFINSLIRFKFKSRLELSIVLVLGALLVVFIGGTVGTSFVSAGESVSTLNKQIKGDGGVSLQETTSTLLSSMNQSNSAANKPLNAYSEQRKNERLSLIKKYDVKIKADEKWARKTKVKNYVSSNVQKKANSLRWFDEKTTDELKEFGVSISATTSKSSEAVSSLILQLSKSDADDENRQNDRNLFWEFLWVSISVFATFITVSTIVLEQLIVVATTEKEDDTNDTNEQAKTYNPEPETITPVIKPPLDATKIEFYESKAKEYLDNNLRDTKDGLVISQNVKNAVSNWFSRGKSNGENSSNYVKYKYAIKHFAMYNVEVKESPTHENRVVFLDSNNDTEM